MQSIGENLRVPKPNPHLHSEIHLLVDEIRKDFGETAKKGKGSFGFYLGFFNRIGKEPVYRLWSEVKQSNCRSPKKLFWWKLTRLLQENRVDKTSQQNH